MANKLSIDFYSHSPVGDVHNSCFFFFYLDFVVLVVSFGYSSFCNLCLLVCECAFNSLLHLHLPEKEEEEADTTLFFELISTKKNDGEHAANFSHISQ